MVAESSGGALAIPRAKNTIELASANSTPGLSAQAHKTLRFGLIDNRAEACVLQRQSHLPALLSDQLAQSQHISPQIIRLSAVATFRLQVRSRHVYVAVREWFCDDRHTEVSPGTAGRAGKPYPASSRRASWTRCCQQPKHSPVLHAYR